MEEVWVKDLVKVDPSPDKVGRCWVAQQKVYCVPCVPLLGAGMLFMAGELKPGSIPVLHRKFL